MNKFFKNISVILSVTLLITAFGLQPIFAKEASALPAPTAENTAVTKSKVMATALLNDYGAISLQYAIIDQNRITESSHCGVYSKTENRALTPDIMYGIGSVSKMFATTAMMKLVEMGKVSLDTPVVNYLPDFTMADERYKDITVRMLLNHSSGLMGSTTTNGFLFDDKDNTATRNLLANLKNQRLKADPGSFSVYCNDGFTLAELVIERVSGMAFTAFIHEYITKPLGMENTKTPADEFDASKLAKIYSQDSTKALPQETLGIIGAGGIYSTAEDMCKFATIFMKDQGTSSSILSKDSTNLMASSEYLKGIWPAEDHENVGMLSFGLGWDNVNGQAFFKSNIKELVKGGDTLFYHSSIVVLPDQNMAAVVLSSGSTSTYNQLLAEELLTEALQNKGIKTSTANIEKIATTDKTTTDKAISDKSITASGITVPQNILEYQGYYAGRSTTMLIKITTDGAMTISAPNLPGYIQRYIHTGNGIFKDPVNGEKVSFVREANGNTYLQAKGSQSIPSLGAIYANQYVAQKVENNPISSDIQKAWDKRSGKLYYILTEKFNSEFYLTQMPVGSFTLSKNSAAGGIDGYAGPYRLDSENSAKNILQLPGMQGRDINDIGLYKENGCEYLKIQANLCLNEDSIEKIYNGHEGKCTITNNGYAKWYKVGDAAGKTMNVKIPKNASFAVYNQMGACLNASFASGKTSIVLPDKGSIVFAGNAGSQFVITMK